MTLPGVSNIASLLFAGADRMYAALRARPERRPWGHLTRCGAAAALFLLALAPAARAEDPTPGRQQQLLRMVRQDCGACHGMQLTGGLGPAITASALADRGFDMVFATIWFGRQGTPMPPWRGLLTEAEARWMAQRLMHGLPAGEGR
jgi:cytochrome c55X